MIDIESISKICKSCGKEKSSSDFWNLHSTCKVCRSVEHKMWVEKNRDKLRKYKREVYQHHIEQHRSYNRNYHRMYQKKDKVKEKRHEHYLRYKEQHRDKRLQSLYGITQIEYNEMFIIQDGCCAICGKHQTYQNKPMCVDHNHSTNEVRGLLCRNCNLAIGFIKENTVILKKMVEYLSKVKGY